MWYGVFADIVVAVHLVYVSFVLFGQLAIVAGVVLKWGWVRNLWFRAAHLLAIAVVAAEALLNIRCPLTIWESQLRGLAGQEISDASFIGRLLHNVMFFDLGTEVFNIIYVTFALLVLGTFVMAPPRWRPSRKQAPRLEAHANAAI